jgi:hypothetical protein
MESELSKRGGSRGVVGSRLLQAYLSAALSLVVVVARV